jgi:hypothetical protein
MIKEESLRLCKEVILLTLSKHNRNIARIYSEDSMNILLFVMKIFFKSDTDLESSDIEARGIYIPKKLSYVIWDLSRKYIGLFVNSESFIVELGNYTWNNFGFKYSLVDGDFIRIDAIINRSPDFMKNEFRKWVVS